MVHGLLAPVKHNMHGGHNVCNLPLVAPRADQLCTILTSPDDSGRGILERMRRVGERQQHIASNTLVGFGPASVLYPRTAAFQCPHPSIIPSAYGTAQPKGVRAPAHASIGHGRLRSVPTLRESSVPCPPLSHIALTRHTSSFARRRHRINHRSEGFDTCRPFRWVRGQVAGERVMTRRQEATSTTGKPVVDSELWVRLGAVLAWRDIRGVAEPDRMMTDIGG
jgi:hypothetical protein